MSKSGMGMILDELVKNSSSCVEKMKKKEEWKRIEEELKKAMMKSDRKRAKKRKVISNDVFDEFEELKKKEEEWNRMDVCGIVDEVERMEEKVSGSDSKVYVFSDGKKKEISNELVKKYPECLLNVNMIDVDSRSLKNEVEIDFRFKYLDEMVNYIANEFDIWKLSGVEFEEFCEELMEMNVPFRMDIMNRLCSSFNEYGTGWKNRCVTIKRKEYTMIVDCIMKEWKLNELKYNDQFNRVEYTIKLKYKSIIQSFSDYLHNELDSKELVSRIDRYLLLYFLDEYPLDMTNRNVQAFLYPIYSPFLKESTINEQQYDDYLREWIGDYQWELLYRASEHNYTYVSNSFHRCCDDKGPTLVLIKSSEGWIFGGYTTQSWRGKGIYMILYMIINR